MIKFRACSAALVLWLLPFMQTGAHHSGAMFDNQKPLTLSGTVRQFQWTSPHCYIQLVVSAPDGKVQEWSLEMGAQVYLYRLG